MTELLRVDHLTIHYRQNKTVIPAVRDVRFQLEKGQTLGIVGESGCGKSTLAMSLIGLLPKEGCSIPSGEIFFDNKNLLANSEEEWRNYRGRKIAMIFQDPFSSLNPVLTVGYQLMEALKLDDPKAEKTHALHLLDSVQLADKERIFKSYPHQLSGGQRQRVMIACALSRKPELLIADEPTTALDVTIQDEIITLLKSLQAELKMAMIFVTHNLGLISEVAENLAVMYAGQIVEQGPTSHLLKAPKHPYTQGLLKSLPKIKRSEGPLATLEGQPPDPRHLPTGCPFHPRCPSKFDPCPSQDPEPRNAEKSLTRCHLYPVK